MRNVEEMYFLEVKQAEQIAAKHQDEENWEIWTDEEARQAGDVAQYDKASAQSTRKAS